MEKRDSWRTREPRRRRDFDDSSFGRDNIGWPGAAAAPPQRPAYRAPSATAAGGPEVAAVVKWYNPDKGFGFVELDDGTGDAFLHASAVERAGSGALAAGTTLRVRVGQGQKGRQVTEITHVGEAGPAPVTRAPPREFSSSAAVGQEIHGTVKWFNATKGFGFITPDGGGKDVFVHVSALARSGIQELREGQAVRVQVVQGKKGPEAGGVELS